MFSPPTNKENTGAMKKESEKASIGDYSLTVGAGLSLIMGGLFFEAYPYLKFGLLMLGLLLAIIAIVKTSPISKNQQTTFL